MDKRILLFGGTRDGREIAELLAAHQVAVLVCVATDYGKDMLQENKYLTIQMGRMDLEEMISFMEKESFMCVIDATHPFAVAVSHNIKEACKVSDVPYLRYSREIEDAACTGQVHFAADSQEAVRILSSLPGNVLLTTGSKELHVFTQDQTKIERIYARVLPSLESIQLCLDAGLLYKQIIAMHGPFSEAMNYALLEQYQIQVMVTKETGSIGGFQDKMHAAQRAGCHMIVIKNPELEKHYNQKQLFAVLEEMLQIKLAPTMAKEIKIIGLGMGQEESMTIEAKNALQEADMIFGSARLLETLQGYPTPKEPIYRKDEILAYLQAHTNLQYPVVVVSGDVGFYSGGSFFREGDIKSTFICGVSSLSYFCAKLHMPWQDVHITSMHGRCANIIGKVLQYDKVFTILSSLQDVRDILDKIRYYEIQDCRVIIGFHLSYPDEKILVLQGDVQMQLEELAEHGLYVCMIQRTTQKEHFLSSTIPDDAFIRGKVPMTKEEIRSLSLAKLSLHKGAVVYDIGAGTGSISIGCALLDESIQVYAIEKNSDAVTLLQANQKKFCADGMHIIAGEATEVMENLPTPTHAFIGGSSGNLCEIIKLLWKKNPRIRIVLNTVTMETQAEVLEVLHNIPHEEEEIVQIAASNAKSVGKYHLFYGQNPVTIIAFTCMEGVNE